MKYIIIDDKKEFAEMLCNKLNGNHNCNNECLQFSYTIAPDKLVSDIKKRTEKEPDSVILISVNLNVGSNTRQNQKGIELLKLLRLEGSNNHCILYSFQDFLYILKSNPLNSIMHSNGVSFIQLPFLTTEVLNIKTSELAIKENLLPFFRAEVDLVGIRHVLANIYGIQKMIEAHSKIYNDLNSLSIILSDKNKYIYRLVEYLQESSKSSKSINWTSQKEGSIKKKLKQIIDFKAIVFYLDDQANMGWFAFLKNIIGSNLIKIDFNETDNEHTLFHKFKFLQNKKTVDLFICDLRLTKAEEHLLNFKELISYKLVQKIRNDNPKQKVMYFSATNDLNKYKSILTGAEGNPDKYKPQYIFTKEGIDQNYTKEQSFHNYEALVDFLETSLKSECALKKVQSLSLFDSLRAEQILLIEEEMEKLKSGGKIENSPFEKFDLVIFDTNAFYDPKISIQILRHINWYPEKSCIHLSVFAEMKKFVDVNKYKAAKEVQWLLALKCSEYIKESGFVLSEECMTTSEIQRAENLELGKDFADKFLVSICKEKSKTLKVLFVSSDRASGERKGRGEADGPVKQLQYWIKKENNSNLKISSVNSFIHPQTQAPIKSINPQATLINNQLQAKENINNEQSPQKENITSEIIKIEKTSTRKSYRFQLDNKNSYLIPVASFNNSPLDKLKELFNNKSISYFSQKDFMEQVLKIVESQIHDNSKQIN